MKTTRRGWLGAAIAAAAIAAPAAGGGAEKVDQVLAEQGAADRAAAQSQERIGKLEDQGQESLAKYRQLLAEAASYRQYDEQLSLQVESQAQETAKIRRQLDEIEVTAREVLPLMQRMVATLEEFVRLDVPFLLEERTRRVATLKGLMPRADVSISEKYRRILEAYQIEMEYGRTVDAYDGKLDDAGAQKTVEFVRLGRVSLMYRTLDGREVGYWHQGKRAWVKDLAYAPEVKEALRIAKKQGAPDMFFLPVPAPAQVTE